jgi:hypothetical protein
METARPALFAVIVALLRHLKRSQNERSTSYPAMNTAFTFEAERFDYAGPAGRQATEFEDQEAWEINSPYSREFEFEGGAPIAPPPALGGAALARAVAANRVLARQFGWGCVIGGHVQPIQEILTLLGLVAGASEEDIARAIARWQQTQFGRPGDGQLGPATWAHILRRTPAVIPPFAFKRAAWDVMFGGQKLGVLEKTAPYEQCYLEAGDVAWTGTCRPQPTVNTTRAGARIQLGFRISNMAAVQRAGFVHPDGEPHFNFTQMIETNRPLVPGPPVQTVRRYRRLIDPTVIARDNNPYFWDEPGPPGDIAQNIHRVAADAHFPRGSRLCYDVLFWDYATRALADADPPGLGLYWNAEVVLVGIRAGNRNVTLNSVKWGFDIRPAAVGPTIRLNALLPGPSGGSPMFRQVLAQEIRAGNFPAHCFVGGGFGRGAVCT